MWPRKVGESMPMRGGCTRPHALAYFSWLDHLAKTGRGKIMPMPGGCTQAPCIGILSPYLFWAMWPRKVGEMYANASPTFLGHVAQRSRGKAWQCLRAACNPTRWHILSLLFWTMWPRTVGEQYANASGLHAAHALAYFSPTLSGPCDPAK